MDWECRLTVEQLLPHFLLCHTTLRRARRSRPTAFEFRVVGSDRRADRARPECPHTLCDNPKAWNLR
jgi:hypothetical protein